MLNSAGPAFASDHRPPKMSLEGAEAKQRGRLISYCWTGPGISECADGSLSFPPSAVDVGNTADIAITKSRPPHKVVVALWKNEEGDFRSWFETTAIPQPASATSWRLRIPLPPTSGDYLITVSGEWLDEHYALGMQDATWAFHAR